MKQLHINLRHKYKVNYIRIAMGFILMALIVVAFIRDTAFFKPLHLALFSIASLYYIAMGFGFNPFTFWGKAYININTTNIEIKPSIFQKPTLLQWQNCKQVSINVSSIRFSENNATTLEFDYQKMEPDSIKELKQAIISICKEKGIALV